MLDGYIEAFPDNGQTKLVVFSKRIPEAEECFKSTYGYRKDIEFILNDKPFTQEELVKLYHKADCYVNISHGEGLSMPDLEAMSTGLPVIGSNWDSRGEFLDDDVGWMVKIKELSHINLGLDDCGCWATYDQNDYIYKLRYVVNHPEEVVMKGKKGAERIRAKFTPRDSALAMDMMFVDIKTNGEGR
jgi:glycosyltransferase involved in cell wall biosynthesis